MGHGDESDIDAAGATLGGYERGCIVAVQIKVFLSYFVGAVIIIQDNTDLNNTNGWQGMAKVTLGTCLFLVSIAMDSLFLHARQPCRTLRRILKRKEVCSPPPMNEVNIAVVPMAGLGTRLLPNRYASI